MVYGIWSMGMYRMLRFYIHSFIRMVLGNPTCIPLIVFSLQIITTGSITDFTAGNNYWVEVPVPSLLPSSPYFHSTHSLFRSGNLIFSVYVCISSIRDSCRSMRILLSTGMTTRSNINPFIRRRCSCWPI